MCRAIDAAFFMVNRSIDIVENEGNTKYYMDTMKLHKLLYLAQCCMLAKFNRRLFVEDITAHMCGPYVDNISVVSAYCGFGEITKKCANNLLPITRMRELVLELVLREYGDISTEDIVDFTKETFAYRKHLNDIKNDYKPTINDNEMIQTGKELFSDFFDELDVLKL